MKWITRLAAVLLAGTAVTCGPDSSTGPDAFGRPAAMLAFGGNDQRAVVGTELPNALVAKVVDSLGRAVRGQIVNFRVAAGGGSVFAGAALTNEDGLASERWTLGTSTADSQRVEVRAVDAVTGTPIVYAVFRAIALPGPVATLTKVHGDAQTAVIGTVLPETLTVRAADRYDNPVDSALVQWTAAEGSAAPASGRTVEGLARTRWTLGITAGNRSLVAAVGTIATTFTARALAGAAASVSKSAGDGQTVTAGLFTPVIPAVTVRDASGNPVPQATVTFSITSGGGSNVRASTTTDTAGIATAGGWRLGSRAGLNTLQAAVAGLTPVTFTVTGVAGPPAFVTKLAGDTLWATPGSTTGVRPSVRVTDTYGNPVPRTAVAFVAAGGGSVGTGDTLTNDSGIAVAGTWTLGRSAAPNTLTATAAGPVTATFSANLGTVVASVAGTPMDAAGDRVLYLAGSALHVLTVGTGADQLVMDDASRPLSSYAYLTPVGAIFVEANYVLDEWRGGAVVSSPALNGIALVVNGAWALFSRGSTLVRRDLTTGTDQTISTTAGNNGNGIAANGEVAFWTAYPYAVYRFRNDSTVRLSSPADTLWNTSPATDGVNVVYLKSTACCNNRTFWTILHDGVGETVLTGPTTDDHPTYQVSNGWTAYTVTVAGGIRHVWSRSPSGVTSVVAALGASCRIAALGPAGELVVASGSQIYYSAPPYAALTALGTFYGRVLWDNGRFLGLGTAAVYRLTP